jgi:hypothetical protein
MTIYLMEAQAASSQSPPAYQLSGYQSSTPAPAPSSHGSQSGAYSGSEEKMSMTNSYSTRISSAVFGSDIRRYYVSINDYARLHNLGKGAFGQVYAARHRTSGAVVAVKVISLNREDPQERLHFVREIELLAILKHPAILTCTDAQISTITMDRQS